LHFTCRLNAPNTNPSPEREPALIQIPLTPEQFQSKAAQIATQQGINLIGSSGTIEKMGVKADWIYEDGVLTITIVDKPAFLPTSMVEEQLKKLL